MARIEIRLKDKEKEAWQNFCKVNGLTGAGMLRQMIKHITKDKVSFDKEKNVETKNKSGVMTIRFEPGDIKAIEKRSIEEGFDNKSQWVRSIVLNALDNHPVLIREEVQAIREANRELAAIGRNLNQIAKVMNIDSRLIDPPELEMLTGVVDKVKKQQSKIMNLVSRSQNRWMLHSTD